MFLVQLFHLIGPDNFYMLYFISVVFIHFIYGNCQKS